MTNRKTTKRALMTSVLAIFLCLTMLVGTTFAWFTDTASTGVNTIQAGKLDVQMLDANGNSLEGKTLQFVKADGAPADEAVLWEPGCTYSLQPITIKNAGDLALKFKVVITGINGDAKLNEVIDWTIKVGEESNTVDSTYNLTAGEELVLNIEGHMQENAGNAYQGLTIEGISITVYATQLNHEYDSEGNEYDKDAKLPTSVNGQEALNAQFNTNDSFVNLVLSAGTYTLPQVANKQVTIYGGKDTVVNMTASGIIGAQNADLDIIFDGVTVKFSDTADYKGITHSKKVTYNNCTLIGKQFLYAEDVEFVNCTFINNDDYAVWTYGAGNATFEGCTFISGGKAILIYTEDASHTNNVVVNNCVFYDNGNLDTVKAAIEIGDSRSTAGLHVNLTATNNKIYGFANNNEGTASGNKMWGNKDSIPADRLNVTASGNTEYDATVAITDDAAIVAKALKANTKTIEIILTGDVEVTVDSGTQLTNAFGGSATETVTIDGNNKYTLTFKHPDSDANHVATNAAKLILKNLKLTNSGYNDGPWNRHDIVFDCEVELENVVSDKAIALGKNATLKNVEITDNSGEVYGLWITADGQTVNLNNVEIDTNRAIAIKDQYRATTAKRVTLNINNSKFTSAKKAAVLVSSQGGATITAGTVDISNVAADQTNLVWKDNGTSDENGFVYATANVTVTGGNVIVEP